MNKTNYNISKENMKKITDNIEENCKVSKMRCNISMFIGTGLIAASSYMLYKRIDTDTVYPIMMVGIGGYELINSLNTRSLINDLKETKKELLKQKKIVTTAKPKVKTKTISNDPLGDFITKKGI